MKFSEFVGNERVVQYFQKAISRDRLGHAFLFSGPVGVGKATLARIVCKALLCRNPDLDGACENCPSCHKFESGNHSDFHPFFPDGLYFKIDQVREIIRLSAFKPVESRWKTFVLQNVDYMREEGANAFLKVLEEPPGQTVLFLITESAEVLLPTIRSRCQHFPLQMIPVSRIKEWLMERRNCTEMEALARASSSHGSLGRALTLNPEQYRETRDKVLVTLEAALLPKTYFTLFDAIKAISVERAEMPERFVILEELLRDLLLLGGSPEANLIHEDAKPRLLALTQKIPGLALQTFYTELLETRDAVLKINANIGLSLQALLLGLRAKVRS